MQKTFKYFQLFYTCSKAFWNGFVSIWMYLDVSRQYKAVHSWYEKWADTDKTWWKLISPHAWCPKAFEDAFEKNRQEVDAKELVVSCCFGMWSEWLATQLNGCGALNHSTTSHEWRAWRCNKRSTAFPKPGKKWEKAPISLAGTARKARRNEGCAGAVLNIPCEIV